MAIPTNKSIKHVSYNGTNIPLVGIVPSGNIALTPSTTAQTDINVKNYETASVAAVTKELLASLDADFTAGNIKKDVDMFGLLGTFEGGGGGSTPVPALSKGVNFIDYDGTVIAAWQTSEVAGKSALPSNPSHSGLTAQGWNWSLANIKSYIADYPDSVVWVGQMYITDDGKTRIYIHLEEGRLSPYLGICPNGSVDVDWGDGSTHDTVTGTSTSTVVNTQHTYAHGGDYVIKLTVTGSMGMVGDSSYGSRLLWKNDTTENLNRCYQNAIQLIEIGAGVTSIGNYAFSCCFSLASITIPSGVTSIGNYAFMDCYSLASITIPSGVTSIGNYAFRNCFSLASITIPSSVTSISNYAFYCCYSLASITIPSSVTRIGSSAFYCCYSLASITIPSSVTSIDSSAFQNCYSLASITIPSSVTSISNSAFSDCYSLASITIPSSVMSISSYAFRNCFSLASITIPDGVTSINTYAFRNCYGLGFIKFTSATPPAVASANAWESVPTDCIIYVPRGSLSAYTTATNYPDPATYSYVEY